ncbi:MAG: tetratricopeptide repeat protein [Porphyrobacter sp.]|nr:tetratricopeptide repeat protein [Porphyrobacter sp.]
MNKSAFFTVILLLGASVCTVPGSAIWAEGAPGAASSKAASPWSEAGTVLAATLADLARGGGILSVAPHAGALEQVLSSAGDLAWVSPEDGTVHVLADGAADALVQTAAYATVQGDGDKRKVVSEANPYPAVALYLGIYYNEIGRSADALRVLDRGLALMSDVAEHRGLLVGEKGAALGALKRFPEALQVYDDGLKLTALGDADRARFYRGRGFALTELNRLDEAEQSYRESLKLEPGNALAQRELGYIEHLRRGGGPVKPQLFLPHASPSPDAAAPAPSP